MPPQFLELKPKQQTIAKAAEKPSGDLSDSEKFTVVKDKPVLITDYETGKAGHYDVTLFGQPHESLGDHAFLWPEHFEEFPQVLKIKQNTFLKKNPKKQSSELSDSDKMPAEKGQLLVIKSAGEIVNKCVEVELLDDDGSTQTMWAFLGDDSDGDGKYEGHVEICGTDFDNKPKDKPVELPPKKERPSWIVTNVPGISRLNMYDPAHKEEAPNILWIELLHGNPSNKSFRCPENEWKTQNGIKLAKYLQKFRNHYNRPLSLNSGFRDVRTNARVGGARASKHVSFQAADFNIQGVHPYEVRAWLVSSEFKNNGIASATCFTHFDHGRGYPARWSYGF